MRYVKRKKLENQLNKILSNAVNIANLYINDVDLNLARQIYTNVEKNTN